MHSSIDRARSLRQSQTLFEKELWLCLRDRRSSKFKFRRQHPIGTYVVDFVCLDKDLIVELDGSQHSGNKEYDAERDAWLQARGFKILRKWNNQWILQREDVLQAILNAVN